MTARGTTSAVGRRPGRLTPVAVETRRVANLGQAKSPWSVTDPHSTLRRSQTRFDSWRGHSCAFPRECAGCTAVFEAAGPGSIPGRGIEGQARQEYVLGVCRIRTRPCEGRGPGSIPGEDIDDSTLEPDGQATGCNPVQVGSTPTGVSKKPRLLANGPAASRPGRKRAPRLPLSFL
jgi:hypothetical protein